jgi:hypothetical protein
MKFVSIDALGGFDKWMDGQGNPENFIQIVRDPMECHAGTGCYRFTFKRGGIRGGVRWVPMCIDIISSQEPAFPRPCISPVNVLEKRNLCEVKRPTFWVRGQTGAEVVVFGLGDENIHSTDRISLAKTWTLIPIDLESADLKAVSVLFFWMATDVDNPQGATFWVDDIQVEGMK